MPTPVTARWRACSAAYVPGRSPGSPRSTGSATTDFPRGGARCSRRSARSNWAVFKGHNLKLTAEYFDPDRKVREDHRTRLGLAWEFTPLPYLQLRAGVRRWDGIPQNAVDNRRLIFFELHGFL